MSAECILTDARIVLVDGLVNGTLVLRAGRIAEVQSGRSSAPGARAMDGDYLIPGAVDLHTDNLERQVQPRSNARWPSGSAMIAHDAHCAAAGATTVFDALCLGDLGFDKDRVRTFREGVADLDTLGGAGLLKAEHFLHLRCEVPAPDMLDLFDTVADHPRVGMVSLMDHTPGVGQYADIERYRELRLSLGAPLVEINRSIAELQETRARLRDANRRALLARLASRKATRASHDDRTAAEIAENEADGIQVSEFPVTSEAAHAARRAGMAVIAGAPNLVRGGSHTGNIAAAELVASGAVDAFASDYVPASLVEAAFGSVSLGLDLPSAIALITDGPARIAGLKDRGRIAPGLRADVVRVRLHDDLPVVRQVWREGQRVA